MSQLKGAAIIGQSGGPSAVINASAYGAIKTALENEDITQVLGARHGIKGVLNDDLMDMGKEDPAELAFMKYTPSSALGSCRYKLADPDEDVRDAAMNEWSMALSDIEDEVRPYAGLKTLLVERDMGCKMPAFRAALQSVLQP